MTLLIVAFLAGVLTIMAPCVLPLLPVIVGGSIAAGDKNSWRRPIVVAASLAGSIVIFTLLLKASTSLLGVPAMFWAILSGLLVVGLGISLTFPDTWEKLALKLRLGIRSNNLLSGSLRQTGLKRDILTGVALGPVFSSCSPTYALIVATIIPQSFITGLIYLVAYAIGLASALLLVTLVGRPLANRLADISNPRGWFMRSIGVSFIVVGVAIVFGLDRDLQAYILEQGWYDPIANFEQNLPH